MVERDVVTDMSTQQGPVGRPSATFFAIWIAITAVLLAFHPLAAGAASGAAALLHVRMTRGFRIILGGIAAVLLLFGMFLAAPPFGWGVTQGPG